MYQSNPLLKIDFMNWPGNKVILQTGLLGLRILAASISPFGTIFVATYLLYEAA